MLTVLFAVVTLLAFGSMFALLDGQHRSNDVVSGVNAEYRMNAMQLRNI